MIPDLTLTEVSRDDVARIGRWLEDTEVMGLWYGADEQGEPLHIGYSPKEMLQADEAEWGRVFNDDARKIFSVYDAQESHIGEVQIVVEPLLHEAQVFVIIGRKDLWLHHFGSAAMLKVLDIAFYEYNLHRIWVDVPVYNVHAEHMCARLGFVLEGHLRSTHPKDGEWYDSVIMGLLETEYARRRPRLLEMMKEPAV